MTSKIITSATERERMHMMVKRLEKVLAMTVLSVSLSLGMTYDAHAMVGGKPVIGISWKSNKQDYTAFKRIIELAGGIPVELDQIKSFDVKYANDGSVDKSDLEPSGMLKLKEANAIKAKKFDHTNVSKVMEDIDGIFCTGGEDISPTLYKVPDIERNHGEGINAARDISDYTLLAYALDKDIPTFAVCRNEQMMGIVHGSTFIQDIPDYYASKGATYTDLHRMPPGTPNRTYARHDVEILPVKSHLREIVGANELKNISSWHHQAVGDIAGTDLIQTARTMDHGVEIVEGIENPNKKFEVGVQFHPENDLNQVLVQKKDPKSFCDLDTCMRFFKALIAASTKDKK